MVTELLPGARLTGRAADYRQCPKPQRQSGLGALWRRKRISAHELNIRGVKNDFSGLPDHPQTAGQCRSWTDLWFLRIKWRHSSGRFSLAAFASLRLGENRRLNKEAHFSRRRKDAKVAPFNSQRP